jgi:hypothetical protein
MPPETTTTGVAVDDELSHSPWAAVLEQLESRLYLYEQFLNGRSDVPPYELPVGLGPIPSELRSRARLLLEVQLDLENRFRERMSALRALLDRPAHAPAGLSLYLDHRG